jgi:hypothetical protein
VRRGGGHRLAAAHAELRPRRVRRLALRAGRAALGRLPAGLRTLRLLRAGLRALAQRGLATGLRAARVRADVVVAGRRHLALVRLLLVLLLAGRETAHAQPGGQERAADGLAALGHALPGAQRHLPGRVLVEPAGQPRVAGVLGQRLELRRVLRREVDVEVAHPGQRHAVGGQLRVGRADHRALDLRRVRRQAQDRPAVADDLVGDVGAHHLQQLVAHPAGDPLVVGHVHGGHQVQDQRDRVGHPHRVVAEHPQRDDQAALGVLHVVDPAAEGDAGVLPGADEVQLRPVGVAAAERVDERAEAGQLLGVDLVPARTHRLHDLPGVDEQRHLVGVHDRPGEPPDADIRPLEDQLVLPVVGDRDELAREECHRGRTSSSTGVVRNDTRADLVSTRVRARSRCYLADPSG